jgi:hypothetical protein
MSQLGPVIWAVAVLCVESVDWRSRASGGFGPVAGLARVRVDFSYALASGSLASSLALLLRLFSLAASLWALLCLQASMPGPTALVGVRVPSQDSASPLAPPQTREASTLWWRTVCSGEVTDTWIRSRSSHIRARVSSIHAALIWSCDFFFPNALGGF